MAKLRASSPRAESFRIAVREGNRFRLEPDEMRYLEHYQPNVIVVDDVLTRGTAMLECIKLVRKQGARVVATGAFMDRSGRITAGLLGVPQFVCLWQEQLPTFTEEECEVKGPCSSKVPIRTDLGHGAEWLKRSKGDQE